MELDSAPSDWAACDETACYRAVQARDPRFDGQFFTAVRTTGIYCRPTCPARTPLRAHVEFFRHAAAAQAAGYRPCLRCRPELAPGSAAWGGTSSTVSRGLRLLEEDVVGTLTVEVLARRLGVGPRHLLRLFTRHVGAPPSVISRTLRTHFAHRLVTGTSLPMTQVAHAAGFASVRTFNEAFAATFLKTPSEVRRSKSRLTEDGAGSTGVTFRLAYRPPYDWSSLAAFLSTRAIPGVERVDDEGYHRLVEIDGRVGAIHVRPDEGAHALVLHLVDVPPAALMGCVRRARAMFDLDADPAAIAARLSASPRLARLVEQRPGLRIPGTWEPFEAGARAVLGQQVTVEAGRTLCERLVARAGLRLPQPLEGLERAFPTPAAVSRADLMGLGVPASRASALQALALSMAKEAPGSALGLSTEDLIERLCSIPGVGSWTAHYVALRGHARPDAFPAGDVVLRDAVGDGRRLSERELENLAKEWKPWGGYAALHLWTEVHVARTTKSTPRPRAPRRTPCPSTV